MIYCVSSYRSVGCTFLDWSIQYLSGQTTFVTIKFGKISLVDNPLVSVGKTYNAHGHWRNHPHGVKELRDAIEVLKSAGPSELLSVYPAQRIFGELAKDLETTHSLTVNDQQIVDFNEIWQECNLQNIPIIFVNLTSDPLYLSVPRQENKGFLTTSSSSIEDQKNDRLNYSFGEKFDDTTPIWDKRELIALSSRPLDTPIESRLDLTIPHFYIDAKELWFNGEETVYSILKFLNLKLDQSRLANWLTVYRTWQKAQAKILKFSWNIDHICEAIVNNYKYDLSEYDLDLWDEAVIQHIMIYRYGLNFRCWQLEKFPTNTQDLYNLLEPNELIVDDIYGALKDIT